MPQKNPSVQKSSSSRVLRPRRSIHQSWNELDKISDTVDTMAKPRDDSFLTTPESSFNTDKALEPSDADDSENDETKSEVSSCTNNEESGDDTSEENEDKRHQMSNHSDEFPKGTYYTPESASPGNLQRKIYILREAHSGDLPEVLDKTQSNRTNDSINKSKGVIIGFTWSAVLLAVIAALLAVICYAYQEEKIDFKLVKEEFSTQDEFLWLAFESGVTDVARMSRPSTFIFLYDKEAEGTLANLLPQLSKYAVCNITDCSKKPIKITDTELNSASIVRDYGSLIETYQKPLEERGVMIITNLENVRGVSAQAFHSFCDEFTPLVKKSLFIFTMKVNELPGSGNVMKFTEDYFRNKWNDVDIDTCNALITRITSMVIEIRA